MKTIGLTNLGRFGNQMFRYAYARALCEQTGHMLRTERWVGEKIFTLDNPPNLIPYPPPDGTEDIKIDGYCQNQDSLIYTRADCRRWFQFRPEIQAGLDQLGILGVLPHLHLRRGDFASAGYPLISANAAWKAAIAAGIKEPVVSVSDEHPTRHHLFTGVFEFLPDFYRLTRAPILFRANSSFSFWAGVLSHGKVFSPVITGLAGGVEHDNVPFVEGNWPRLAELPNITDLHLRGA